MNIQNDTDMTKWIEYTLEEMKLQMPPSIEDVCPHCRAPILYPLIARKSDIELFEKMIISADKVMQKYGITANLLAEIRAQCLIEIAKRHD